MKIVRDSTERKRAEVESRGFVEAVRLRDRASRAVSQGILITDPNQPDTPVVYASPGFERMTGYRAEEVAGRNYRFLQGPKTDPARVEELRECVRAGRGCAVELLNSRENGTPFRNAQFISPVRDERGRLPHFVGVQADVAERHDSEDQVRQARKMEAVGRPAGGVAHDFNNLLTVICGYSEILPTPPPPSGPPRESVGAIGEAGGGADPATPVLQQTGGAGNEGGGPERGRDGHGEVAAAGHRRGRRADGISRPPGRAGSGRPRPHRASADEPGRQRPRRHAARGQADHPDEGVELDEADANTHVEVPAGRDTLPAVPDTGTGMPPEVEARIFEPFYTTKGAGRGTGLGLSVGHGIVQQTHGHVGVYSELGVGTAFKRYLPVAGKPATPAADPLDPPRAGRGSETVLLVVDEDSVRELALLALRTQEYTVLAANGKEAIRVVDRHTGGIDILVADVVTPEIGGRQLAEALRHRLPKMSVLYLSGYTDDSVVRHGIPQEEVAFPQKPYTPMGFLRKSRQVSDAGEPSSAVSDGSENSNPV